MEWYFYVFGPIAIIVAVLGIVGIVWVIYFFAWIAVEWIRWQFTLRKLKKGLKNEKKI